MIVKSQDGKLVVTLDAFPDRIFTEETLTHAVGRHFADDTVVEQSPFEQVWQVLGRHDQDIRAIKNHLGATSQ